MATTNQGQELTPEQFEWMMQHESDTRVPGMIANAVVTAFFSTVFVALRLLGRRLAYRAWRVQINDWLLIISWVFFLACVTSFALLTRYGGGRHIIFVNSKRGLQIGSILAEAFYALAMGFMKLSILSLYGTIFPAKKFHYYLWGLMFFTFSWMLTAFLGAVLQCIPIELVWNKDVKGTCIQHGLLQLVVTVCNILTDFVILFLPIPEVRKLQMAKAKKRLVILTFAIGSSACIVSIVRLVFALQVGSLDGSWTAIPAGYLSATELAVGFLVVSVPTYRPLYQHIFGGNSDSMARSGNSYGSRSNKSGGSYQKSGVYSVKVSASHKTMNDDSGINITNDVELVRHANQNGNWVRITDNEEEQLVRPSVAAR